MKSIICVLFCCSTIAFACSSETGNADTDTDTDTSTDTNSDTDSNTESDLDTETETGTDSQTDSNSDSDSDSGSNLDSDSDSDSDSETDLDSETDSDTGTDSDSDSDSDSETDISTTINLISPADTATINDTAPTLEWEDTAFPNGTYHVQIALDYNFLSIVEEADELTDSTYTLTTALSNLATYYWRVAVVDESDTQWEWSTIFTFDTDLYVYE